MTALAGRKGELHVNAVDVLIETWEHLRHRVRRARFLSNLVQDGRWPEAVHEHEDMLAALTARDGYWLASLIRPHFMNGLEALTAGREESRISRRTKPTASQGG